MLFPIVKDSTTSADELNHDFQTISEWAHQWKLEFNPDPSKQATELLFSQKKYQTYHPPLRRTNLTVVLLGVSFSKLRTT